MYSASGTEVEGMRKELAVPAGSGLPGSVPAETTPW